MPQPSFSHSNSLVPLPDPNITWNGRVPPHLHRVVVEVGHHNFILVVDSHEVWS